MSAFLVVFPGRSRVQIVRDAVPAPPVWNSDADTRVQCHCMKGAVRVGMENDAEKAERKWKGGKRSPGIHILRIKIQWKENKKPVQQLIAFSMQLTQASMFIPTGKLDLKSKNNP